MRYLSLCSGIEAASNAWKPLGWEAVGFSEIEPFPCAVLKERFPNVTNYGDMTKYKEWEDVGQFDVLVGGTPCQSFSVAGLRRGLEDPRGNLMLTYGAIANHFKPRVIVWENVPGVLSSGGGRDFGTFLGMLAECGYGFAYRVLDAQYFGVPQRRRRVFVIGYLGDWRRAAQILFESESLRGDNPPSRKTGEDVAGTISARTSGGGGLGTDFELGGGLQVRTFDRQSSGEYGTAPVASTVSARDYKGAADLAVCYDMRGRGDGNTAPTLCTDHPSRPSDYCPVTFGIPGNWIGREPKNGGNATEPMHDVAPCLTKTDRHGVVAPFQDTADCLTAAMGTKWNGNAPATNGSQFVNHSSAVRRLTPIECERLQGFPDNWTLIPWRGARAEDCPDGPRYKAIGNSMAVPVMRWIGERIEKHAATP